MYFSGRHFHITNHMCGDGTLISSQRVQELMTEMLKKKIAAVIMILDRLGMDK